MDNRVTDNMNLSAQEQNQLTKMSLSKIVTNLRNKLKDEEKRNQSISNKLDQVLKEKEHIKQKYQQLQNELKTKGVIVSNSAIRDATFPVPAPIPGSSKSTSMGAVKSRINTGLSNAPAVESEKDKKLETS